MAWNDTEIIDHSYIQTNFLVYCKIEILSVFRYTKDDLYVNAELHRHASSRELLRYLLCSRKNTFLSYEKGNGAIARFGLYF